MTISVIMPLYNTEQYVGAALESILAQTVLPTEIIVIDDGSTDGSAAVVQRFVAERCGQVSYHWQPHSGAATALNTALALAQGELLAILDADDLWLPTKLADQRAAFAADPALALAFGDVEQFYSPDHYMPGQPIPPSENVVGHIPSAMMVRRAVFAQIGGFDPSWQTGYFLDWFLRAKNAELKLCNLPSVVARRRLHQNNLGRRKRDRQIELVQILRRDLLWRQRQEKLMVAQQFFEAESMIPPAWQAQINGQPVRVFNPALLAWGDQWLLAYRVAMPPDHHHIALCRLDDTLRVQPGTAQSLTDWIVNGGVLPQDPRWVVYRDQLWLYYDHYQPRQPNRLLLVQIDPATLRPLAPARPLVLLGRRQRIEKNWLLFVHEDELYAVYRIAPHQILHLDLTPADHVTCRPVHCMAWGDGGYAARYGELRGGTPPVRVGDCYYSFFHSWRSSSRLDRAVRPPALAAYGWLRARQQAKPASAQEEFLPSPLHTEARAPQPTAPTGGRLRQLVVRLVDRYRRRFEQRWYVVGCYGFTAQPPFAPLCFTPQPLLAPAGETQRRYQETLNPYLDRALFPTGAVWQADGQWLLSAGVDDEQAAFWRFDHQRLLGALQPVAG